MKFEIERQFNKLSEAYFTFTKLICPPSFFTKKVENFLYERPEHPILQIIRMVGVSRIKKITVEVEDE